MSHDNMDSQLEHVAEPLTVTYAYFNAQHSLIWFQVNRTPEETAQFVPMLRLLPGLDQSYFSLDRSGNESVIGLRVMTDYEDFPELFGRVAYMLATCLGAPYSLTLLYKDMHPATNPMRLPAFAEGFGLEELTHDLQADPETALIDELETSFTEVVSSRNFED